MHNPMSRPSDLTNLTEADYVCRVIPSDLRAARQLQQAIVDEVRRGGYSDDFTFAVKLALEEALTNAIKHGNREDPAKHVTVRYHIDPQRIVIRVADEGPGFDPDAVPDCRQAERLALPSGRGIMLMKHYMDEVCYDRSGTEVWLIKRRR